MNKNMKVVRDWMLNQNFENAVVELEGGDFETVPEVVYDAYYQLSEIEKLRTYRFVLVKMIERY